jgi:hypothetical protein
MFPSYSWAGWKGEVNTEWPAPDDADSNSQHDSDSDEDSIPEEVSDSDSWNDSDNDENLSPGEDAYLEEDSGSQDDSALESNDDANGMLILRNSESKSSSPSALEYDYHNSDLDSNPDSDSTSESSSFSEKAAGNVKKSTWIIWYERPPQADLRLINERDNLLERQSDIQALKARAFTARARIKHSVLQTEPTHNLPQLQTQIPNHYSVLQFWTISVKLRLRKFGVSSVHRVDLVDAKDEWCGQLRLPHDFEPQYGKAAELILLATTNDHHILVEDAQMFTGVEHMGYSPRKDPSLPDFYRAMWIQWHGVVAERVAVGEIHYSALRLPVEGKTVWKEIILK